MIHRQTQRLPSAAVSFRGARSNLLVDENGAESSFETVLRVIHKVGDVNPSPGMSDVAPTGVYAQCPFPPSIETMRHSEF